MGKQKAALFSLPVVRGWLAVIGVLALLLSLPAYAALSLGYTETKGPFKNATQVVDWDGDGDLDVVVSHTRWEEQDLSWAGVGIWINQADGTFELHRDRGTGTWPFIGFAAGAGDVDKDWDVDVLVQGFEIRLFENQGRLQGGEPGKFISITGINSPPAYNQGYVDAGGTITLGDLNGDGRIDAFVAGCCYGLNPTEPGYDVPNAPSVSWAWINDGKRGNLQTGYILPLDFLDGHPIRQAALGDLDGDGDLDIYAAVGKPTMGSIVSPGDRILLNDGTGALAALDQPLGDSDSTSVALGDVNGDGRLDVLVGTSAGAKLWINQGVEGGSGGPVFIPAGQSFEAVQTVSEKLQAWFSTAADWLFGLYLPYGSIRTKAVSLADLDGDSDLDALIARLWGAEIWWNDGLGEYRRSDLRLGYPEDTGLVVADFDGDGDQDIFIAGNEESYQSWWNDGKGCFQHPIRSLHLPGLNRCARTPWGIADIIDLERGYD